MDTDIRVNMAMAAFTSSELVLIKHAKLTIFKDFCLYYYKNKSKT